MDIQLCKWLELIYGQSDIPEIREKTSNVYQMYKC